MQLASQSQPPQQPRRENRVSKWDRPYRDEERREGGGEWRSGGSGYRREDDDMDIEWHAPSNGVLGSGGVASAGGGPAGGPGYRGGYHQPHAYPPGYRHWERSNWHDRVRAGDGDVEADVLQDRR